MTFPIARMDLSNSGGSFSTGYGVDYYDYDTPYRYTEDNIPLRNLSTRTKYISDTVDRIIDYLDDGINGSIMRGASDPGESDPADTIETLERFLSASHNANGSIKQSALGDIHPPLTLAAGNFEALRLFVGSQRIKLEAGIGPTKVAAGSDARFAYFDAVVAPNGATSRANAPGSGSPYELYRISPPASFIDGLTYYTSLKDALDDGARRILILEGTYNEAAFGGSYDLTGDDLYLYGIEEDQVIINFPNATLQFNNGSVIFENVKFGGIAGAVTIRTAGTAMTLKRTIGTSDVTLQVISSYFNMEDSTVQNVSITYAIGYIINSTISNYLTIDGVDTYQITNSSIGTVDIYSTNLSIDFVSTTIGAISTNPGSELRYSRFEKCIFTNPTFNGLDLYFVSFDCCEFGATFSLGSTNPLQNLTVSNSLLNTFNPGGSFQTFTFTNNFVVGPVNPNGWALEMFDISENYFNGTVQFVTLYNGVIQNNYFDNSLIFIDETYYVEFVNNMCVDAVTFDETSFSEISRNAFYWTFTINDASNDIEMNSNYFSWSCQFVANITDFFIANNQFLCPIDFSGVGITLTNIWISNNLMNGNDIGTITAGTVNIEGLYIEKMTDVGNIYFDGNLSSVESVVIRDCQITSSSTDCIFFDHVSTIDYFMVDNCVLDTVGVSSNIRITGSTACIVEGFFIRNNRAIGGTSAFLVSNIRNLTEGEFDGNNFINFTVNFSTTSTSTHVLSRLQYNNNHECPIYIYKTSGNANLSLDDCVFSNSFVSGKFFKFELITTSTQAYSIDNVLFDGIVGDNMVLNGTDYPFEFKVSTSVALNTIPYDVKISNILYEVNPAAEAGTYPLLMNMIGCDEISIMNVSVTDVRIHLIGTCSGDTPCLVYHDTPAGANYTEAFMRNCTVMCYSDGVGGTYSIGTFAFVRSLSAVRFAAGRSVAGGTLYAENDSGQTALSYLYANYVFP